MEKVIQYYQISDEERMGSKIDDDTIRKIIDEINVSFEKGQLRTT